MRWNYPVKSFSYAEYNEAFRDRYWGMFMIGLSNMETIDMLKCLEAYRLNRTAYNSGGPNGENRHPSDLGILERDNEVQVDGYIVQMQLAGILDENYEALVSRPPQPFLPPFHWS